METMRATDGFEGVLLVDKPEGPTSNDAVLMARRALGTRRIGHTGTLDPFASGLLLLCVGRATRLVEYFHLLVKRYRAIAVLGSRTDTDDRLGNTTNRSENWRDVTADLLEKAVESLRGAQLQRPPDYSAKKIEGRRAYEVAREGGEPRLERAPVHVHGLEIVEFTPPAVELDCTVSTGTYVRALARDLGEELGCHAHLSSLRRTAIGHFKVEDAVSLEELKEGMPSGPARRSLAQALEWLPRRELDEVELTRVTHGLPLPLGHVEPGHENPVALVFSGRLIAVARGGPDGLRPEKVFPVETAG